MIDDGIIKKGALKGMTEKDENNNFNKNTFNSSLNSIDKTLAPIYPVYDKKSADSNINYSSDLDKTTIMSSINDKSNVNPFQPENDALSEHNAKREELRSQKELEAKRQKLLKIKKHSQRMRTFSHIFGSVLLTVFIISVSCLLAYYTVRAALDLAGIAKSEFEIEIEIPEYATTEQISEILHESNIIDLPGFFKMYSSFFGADGNYLNGMFKVSSTMTYNQLINALQSVSRKTETVSVRIREGMTAREIGLLLEESSVCRAVDFEYFYKNKQNKYNFEKRILMNSMKCFQLEGYLFPDTYEFYVNDSLVGNPDLDTSKDAETVASKIYSNYNSKITKEIYKRANEIGFTLDELMTLASMVQAEAGEVEDMELVASVFLNRLHSGGEFPYLQSDVTIIYAEENIKPLINSRNQGIYSPIVTAYNTYESVGLPPGPICNPGLSAIEAVLYAPDTDYYFFCANPETLEIYYASTIAEHHQNLILAGLE